MATSCSSGLGLTASGACTDILSSVLNCGGVGPAFVCPTSYLHGGSSICQAGACSTTCDSGYAFDSAFQICRSITDDSSNCGGVGSKCSIPNATQVACQSSVCVAKTCASGYVPNAAATACVAIDISTDPLNCGSLGHACLFLPLGATGTCVAKTCLYKTCPTGYSLVNNACVLKASGRARAKRNAVVAAAPPKTLCPDGEQACPIAGSTSFEAALAQHLASGNELTGFLAEVGGCTLRIHPPFLSDSTVSRRS